MKFVQATHAATSNEDPMIARDNQGTIAGELDPDRDRNRRQNRQNGGPANSVLFGPAQIIALAESLSRRASPVRPAISKDFAAATLTGTAEAERQASPAASEDQENGAATSALAAGAANAASGEVDTAHPVGRSGGIPEQPQAEEAEPDVRTGSSDDLDGPQAEQAACPDPREFVSSPDMRPAAEEEAEAAPASGPDPDEASAIGDDAGLTSVTNGDALDLTVADDLPVDADALARRSFVLEPEEGAEPRHEEAAPSSSGAAPRVWGYGRPVLEDSRGAVGSGRRSLFGNRKGSTGSGSALDRLRAYQKLLQARASSRSAPPVPASPDPELQVTRQGSRSADHLGLLAEPAVPPEPETELEPAPDSEALRVADIPPEAGDPEDQEEVAARRAGDEDGSRVAPDDPMLNEERHPSAESNHEITSPSPNLVGGPSLDGEPLAALDHKVALEPVIVEDDLGGRAANSDAQTEPVGPSTESDPASDPVLVVPEVSATPQSHASTGPDDASDEIREASDTLADAAGASPDGGSGAGMDQDNVADASAPNDHGGTTVGLENLVAGADAAAPTLNESDQCGRVDPDVREDPVDAEIRAGANPIARRVSGRREPHATMRAIARLRSWQGAFQRRRDGAGPANAEATTAGAEPIDAIGMDTVRQQVEPVVEGAESLTLTAIGAITEAESAASPVSRPQPPQRRPRATPEIERAAKPRPEHEPASVAEAELGLGVRKRVPARGTRSNTVTAAARGHSAEATPPGDDNKLDSVGKRGRRHWEPGGRRFEDHRDRLRDRTDMSYGRRTSRNDDMAPHRFAGGGGGVEAPWMDLEGILRCMRRRRLFISTIVGVVTLAVVIAVLAVTPRFSATAKVKVADARSAQTLDRPLDPTILYTDEEAIESEVQVITSPQIAHRVIDELGILDDLAPSAAAARAEREAGHRVTLELPRETLGASSSNPASATPEPAGAGSAAQRAQAVKALLDRIEVSREGRSRVISVSVEHHDPVMAARIANAVADTYVATRIEARVEAATKATVWLQDRLADLRSSVTQSETAVERYRQRSGLLEGNGSTIISQQLSDLSARLAAARARRVGLESKLERVEAAGEGGWVNMPEALAHPLISDLRAEEYGLNRRLAELGADIGPNYSQRRKLEAQLQRIRADIATEAQRVVVALRREVEVARVEEATVAEALEALTSEVGDLNINQGALRALEREATANQAVLETFLQWLKRTAGVQQLQEADAQVISYAEMPLHPSFPKKKLFVALAFIGSLSAAAALALIMESLDRSFRSPRQIERLTGYRGLPVIPAIRGGWFRREDPLKYVLRYPRSSYTEALRSLHAGLAVGGGRARPHSILIASAYPCEGKTTVAACYARVLANQGFSVTLVDADLRHGRVAERFGLSLSVGLAEVLAGDAELETAMQRDPETSLRVVVAGQCRQSPQELLHNGMFAACMGQLRTMNDFVIVDSPPVLAVSDANLIARSLDATVYVTRWGVTSREEARTGLRLLQDAGANIAGVVLNATDLGKYAEFAYGRPHIYKKAMAHYYGG